MPEITVPQIPDLPQVDLSQIDAGEIVAVVHTEACVAFVGDDDAPGGVCLACGWLLDEHEDLFAFLATAAA